MTVRPRAIYILDDTSVGLIYGPREREAIARLAEVLGPPMTQADALRAEGRSLLARADVLLSGWGGPTLDADFLARMPNLRAVFYGAGSMAGVLTDAVWDRGLSVTSAIAANGRPVAEYALATILFSLKHGWRLARETRERCGYPDRDVAPGCYGSTVGLLSVGVIARELLRLLKPFDLKVLAYDPFLAPEAAWELGVELATMDEVFARSDVVSVHTPMFPETRGMIGGRHLDLMRAGATFINTARGGLIRQDEMIDVARRRTDLQFVLDVADPEPPPPRSPLYALPNVVMTPHIAGSIGTECRRMGRYMVEELERYVAGQPLRWAVRPELIRHSSHRPVARAPVAVAEVRGGDMPGAGAAVEQSVAVSA